MDHSNVGESDSYDSTMVVGSSRRIPIKIPNFPQDADLNLVELEMIGEEGELRVQSPENQPVQPKKPKTPVFHKTTKTKVFVILYFACCLCLCRRSSKTSTVVPSVANKYKIPS